MKKKSTSHKSRTDLKRLDALKDHEIDLSESPEIPPKMFAKAILRQGLKPVFKKTLFTLRLDQDILNWFRKRGRGYQTRINALLRAYMEAHKLS
jgi:uncharacterized protein (DUF4415 family)